MFINELPDDCLLIIFGFLNELDDLVECYKVCSKWSHLIAERTRKVKYLFDHGYWQNGMFKMGPPRYPFDYVYYSTCWPIDGDCLSTLFPNLMVAEICDKFRVKVDDEDIVALVKKINPLKGLIYERDNEDESIFQYCDQLEMVSVYCVKPYMEKNGVWIKQLKLCNYNLNSLAKVGHYFPNLERLCINDYKSQNNYYNGPIFRKLKILEMCLASQMNENMCYGFQFINSCPNLQSAHIDSCSRNFFVNESKHLSLQDLVIEFTDYGHFGVYYEGLRRSLSNYPNLKHLALRHNHSLDDRQVVHLIRFLPNLVLFDVRGCQKVTQKAADYVQDYNNQHGRTIKFYFDGNYREIKSDWPQLSKKWEKISQGFDFMKNCFLKGFEGLSTFLISNED